MEMLLGAFVVAWLFMRAKDAVVREWRHTRDGYRNQIARDHGDWSPGRVNRAARWRARGYWWNEIASGFPTFRAGWAEHRLLAETERAEAAKATEARLATLRKRLAQARERLIETPGPPGTGPESVPAPDAEPPAPPPFDGSPDRPAATADPAADAGPLPAPEPELEPEPEPWTTDPAPAGWVPVQPRDDERPDDSAWLRPGQRRCEGCGGAGSWHGTTCPACRGFGSAPADLTSPEAAPGTVCAACGNPATDDDAVLDDPAGPVHRSHATEQAAAYSDTLGHMRSAEATAGHSPTDSPATGGDDEMTAATLEGHDTPYEGMQAAHDEQAKLAEAAANFAADDMAAAATTHGFSRDPAYMAALAEAEEAHRAAAAASARARSILAGNHAEGAEYHGTGQDAHASGFRA